MLNNPRFSRTLIFALIGVFLLLPSLASSLHGGIGGSQNWLAPSGENVVLEDVAQTGCLCHNSMADNSVQIILDDVPYAWIPGTTYTLTLQLIGGPTSTGPYYGGFSMHVSSGTLASEDGQNWENDVTRLTHTAATSEHEDRRWVLDWTAPLAGEGHITFWISGNAVNGDQGPGVDDRWNQLVFSLPESDGTADKNYVDASFPVGTRTLFAGDGNVTPPAPEEHGVDLEHMGAELRAHWLGLLGFGAVIAVIIFAGLLLRYGFSTSYNGRSNQLRLRYKLMRRGDQ